MWVRRRFSFFLHFIGQTQEKQTMTFVAAQFTMQKERMLLEVGLSQGFLFRWVISPTSKDKDIKSKTSQWECS